MRFAVCPLLSRFKKNTMKARPMGSQKSVLVCSPSIHQGQGQSLPGMEGFPQGSAFYFFALAFYSLIQRHQQRLLTW